MNLGDPVIDGADAMGDAGAGFMVTPSFRLKSSQGERALSMFVIVC